MSTGGDLWPDCGISPAPGHVHLVGRQKPSSSNHAAMAAIAVKQKMLDEMTKLTAVVASVPLLSHDALQIDIRTHRVNGADLLSISVDGIGICGAPREAETCARDVAEMLSALSPLAADASSNHSPDWPFYLVQNHLVRAPSAGWAALKIRIMIQGRALNLDRLRRMIAEPLPVVMRIEPASRLREDQLVASASISRA